MMAAMARVFERDIHAEPRRHGSFGHWTSAFFNLCAVVALIAGFFAVETVVKNHLYSYEASDAARDRTRAALDRLAARVFPRDGDRLQNWDDLIAGSLMQNDIPGARGLILFGRAVLSPEDVSRLNRAAAGHTTDADLEAAGLTLLTPGTRARYEALVPLLARSGGERPTGGRAFVLSGDLQSFDEAARADIRDAAPDHLGFVLTGVSVLRSGVAPAQVMTGASIVQAGIAARRLTPAFLDDLQAGAAAALPRARFRMIAASLDGAYADAFRAALDPAALARLEITLQEIGAMADAAGPQLALALLRQARDSGDLRKLRLLAETNPDRAAALANLAPVDGAVANSARGALKLTTKLVALLACVALAFVGMAWSAIVIALTAARHYLANFFPPPERPPGDELIDTFKR